MDKKSLQVNAAYYELYVDILTRITGATCRHAINLGCPLCFLTILTSCEKKYAAGYDWIRFSNHAQIKRRPQRWAGGKVGITVSVHAALEVVTVRV
ncbi:unnamed protein product [Pieris macdunnoughi]|uniref:Uncharacterized protein n=1 Tax=Pieris macdunnoughi TaxID=345717 RepID=A0A821QN87_9NEOP|nr:unnamed protein product [Pieris macdunnoughi]